MAYTNLEKHLRLEDKLSSDKKPVKIGDEVSGLLLNGKDVHIEGNSTIGGDAIIGGDIVVTGNTLTFGNEESISNTADGQIVINTSGLALNSLLGSQGAATFSLLPESGEDAIIQLYEGLGIKWSIANDADDSDKLKIDAGTATVGGATKLTLDASGNMILAGDLQVNGDDIKCDGAMNLEAEGGAITLDASNGNFLAKKDGTEFSAANSAYAGMILGYTRLQGDLSNYNSYEIQNALTVEDATHQITFKTPPSELVEIQCNVYLNAVSTDVEIQVGLSDSDTYNAVSAELEYDVDGVFKSDDEADKYQTTFNFVLSASHLASVGSSNTFYIGFGTGGATKSAYVQYGLRSSHGLCYPPFTIKATALPATIYDGL